VSQFPKFPCKGIPGLGAYKVHGKCGVHPNSALVLSVSIQPLEEDAKTSGKTGGRKVTVASCSFLIDNYSLGGIYRHHPFYKIFPAINVKLHFSRETYSTKLPTK